MRRRPVGTRIRFRVSEDAAATLTFQRAVLGRRVGSRCLPNTRARRGRARCTRYVRAGGVLRLAKAGLNTVRFAGRITARRRLALGSYRVLVGATDRAGNISRSRTSAVFRVVAR